MNRYHQKVCSSAGWAEFISGTVLPQALAGLTLGPRVLELGPGYGASTGPLAQLTQSLTALESDPALAARLAARLGGQVNVVHGDATGLPFGAGTFTSVVCFTMLHHVRGRDAQDRLFAEAARVLEPGGVFAGTDSVPSLRWRLVHLGDTCVPVDSSALPGRLARAGFTRIQVERDSRVTRFAAHAPDREPGAGQVPGAEGGPA